jgi:NADH-quinone oxidoreductase subunit L
VVATLVFATAAEAGAEGAAGIRNLAWLIPALPYAAFFIIMFFGKKFPRKGSEIGIAAIGISLLVALGTFFTQITRGGHVEKSLEWVRFGAGDHVLELGMNVDGLAAVMFVVVCVVSLLVQAYSTEYMKGDRRYTWYYAALSLFTGSMLNLVIANNLLQLLVGWEGVGVCSYFLIGHWFEDKPNSNAAMKAFLTTRVGDVGFMLGIFVLFFAAGTFNIGGITEAIHEGHISTTVITVGAVLLFCGAIGKSAQMPLHVWLPDAMAGPTPVSALIHAATMVVAGVYLVARMFGVFHASSVALNEVAIIGACTMLFMALLALVQDDIKKVLAYSTLSQLGYMVAGLGVGAPTAAVFHIWTHAWFKALLFLGAGSVSHAVHSFSMKDMGGLKEHMPITFRTYMIGSLALAGLFPLAGFWSKDEIIHGAYVSMKDGSGVGQFVFYVALITAFLTACYAARMVALTFYGKPKYDTHHVHPHESPKAITTPLIILSILAVVGGWVGLPGGLNLFGKWVEFAGVHHGEFNPSEYLMLAGVSTALAVAGFGIGWMIFKQGKLKIDILRTPLKPLYVLLQHKYYFDDIYMKGIVIPIRDSLSRMAYWFNTNVLDGVVNAAGIAGVALGRFTYNILDQKVVDGGVNGLALGVARTSNRAKFWQTGNVQAYAAALFLGIGLFVGAFLIFKT